MSEIDHDRDAILDELAAAEARVARVEALIESCRGNHADEPDGGEPVLRNYVLISELEAALRGDA